MTMISVGGGPGGAWSDLADVQDQIIAGEIERAYLLHNGTVGSRPSVDLLIRLPDGRLVHVATTWRLWESTTEVLRALAEKAP